MARKNSEKRGGVKRNLWIVENVDEETRKIVKLYALEHDTTIAVALKQLVEVSRSALNHQK